MYDYKANGEIDKFIQTVDEFLAGPYKRAILINPLDSAFVFATPLFIHLNPAELSSKVLAPFAKILWETMSLKMFGKKGIGGQILGGTFQPAYLNDASMENVPLILKHGFPMGFANALLSITDKVNSGKYAAQQKGWERVSEFALTGAGVNRAIYEQIILRGYVYLVNKIAKGYMKRFDLGKEEAIRQACGFVEETSMLYNPDMWNRSLFWKAMWISRGLVLGPVRTLGMVAQSMGMKTKGLEAWTKKMHKPKVGSFHSITNPVLATDKTAEDVEFLGARIGEYIGRSTAWMYTMLVLIQFLASFLDDDETGDKGNFGAAKRFPWNNPGMAKFFPRAPYKDDNGDRVYWSPMMLRDVRERMMYMMSAAASWGGKTAVDMLSGKLNFIWDWMRAFILGQDYQGRTLPGFEKNLPWQYKLPAMTGEATKRLRVLGTEPIKPVSSLKKELNWARQGANVMGVGEKTFPEVEPGMREVVIEPEDAYRTPEERLKRWKQLAAINRFMSEMAIKDWREMTDDELTDKLLKKGATEQQIRGILEQRQSKTAYWLKENASSVVRGSLWQKGKLPVKQEDYDLSGVAE
jgi:hypothetical protein